MEIPGLGSKLAVTSCRIRDILCRIIVLATWRVRCILCCMATASLGSHKIMAFVATRDPVRAKSFYRDTLGLRLVSEDRFALVFDAHGTMLRVTTVHELA